MLYLIGLQSAVMQIARIVGQIMYRKGESVSQRLKGIADINAKIAALGRVNQKTINPSCRIKEQQCFTQTKRSDKNYLSYLKRFLGLNQNGTISLRSGD